MTSLKLVQVHCGSEWCHPSGPSLLGLPPVRPSQQVETHRVWARLAGHWSFSSPRVESKWCQRPFCFLFSILPLYSHFGTICFRTKLVDSI